MLHSRFAPRPTAGRRRPLQSRALQTSQALQDAFVRLLVERGYAAITVREIVLVAGTGLGSFYEYFASKQDLAQVSLHLRSKALLLALRQAASAQRGQPLQTLGPALVQALWAAHQGPVEEWGAHYLLERQFSSLQASRNTYERFVEVWAQALRAASEMPSDGDVAAAARTCQGLVYGLFTHAFLRADAQGAAAALPRQATAALTAYLALLPMEASASACGAKSSPGVSGGSR
jgi:AcrR family transcriptional regulator